MRLWLKFSLLSIIIIYWFAACQNQNNDFNRITEGNFVNIAAESVRLTNIPAAINNLNTALVFSANTLHTAQGLNTRNGNNRDKLKVYLQRSLGKGEAISGPMPCPQGGERDNQIVNVDQTNMTVSLVHCQYNGKVANGFVQISKLEIEGVPLAQEAWTISMMLTFDLTITDAGSLVPPITLVGDAYFTMTAVRQLYSMNISGRELKVGFAGDKQSVLKDYNLLTANDSANGYHSIKLDGKFISANFGEFHIKTDPHLVVDGGKKQSCSGTMSVFNPNEKNSASLVVTTDPGCESIVLYYDKDGDGVFEADSATSWTFLSSL